MRNGGGRWPWLAAAGYVTAVAIAAVSLAALQASLELTVLGLVISVGAAAFTWAAQRSRQVPGPSDAELERAGRALAAMVKAQWDDEAAARGLLDPGPIPVRWHSAQDRSGDHAHLVGGEVSGSCGDAAGFAQSFLGLPHRRLVVLGEPGAGKSTLALLLVRALLAGRAADDPVPVLLSLSSWNPEGEPLAAWIARRLREDYPALSNNEAYGHFAAGRLVSERRVLAVLDGLDELSEPLRPAALIAVNRALAAGLPLVLTCRTVEFDRAVDAADVVTAAAVVVAEPVAPEDALSFLANAVPPRRRAAWDVVFEHVRVHPDGPLATALLLPLNVWLIRAAYGRPGADPTELLHISDLQSLQDHLLDALIPAAFTGSVEAPDLLGTTPDRRRDAAARQCPDEARAWLGALAGHLRGLGTDQLAWWQLRGALRPDPVGPLSGPLLGAVFGLGAGCLAADTLDFAMSDPAQLVGFLILTLATSIGAAAVVVLTATAMAARTWHAPIRSIGLAIAILAPLAVCVGAVVDHEIHVFPHTAYGNGLVTVPQAVAPAALFWAAGVVVFGLGAALSGAVLRRLRSRSAESGSRRLPARVGRTAVLAVVFLLGAVLGGLVVYIPVGEHPGSGLLVNDNRLRGDMFFVCHRAFARTLVLLVMAGSVLAQPLPADLSAPGCLSLAVRHRLRLLTSRVPSAAVRGLLFGLLLGAAAGLATPGSDPLEVKVTGLMLIGAIIGVVCGTGSAVIQWARVPADTDATTPVSTLTGDRRLTAVVFVALLLPPLAKWAVAVALHLAAAENRTLQTVSSVVETPGALLAIGAAVGLIFASETAWYSYAETCLRLARARRLPRATMAFLEDARSVGILRSSGAFYEFCHVRLRDRLADRAAAEAGKAAAVRTVPAGRCGVEQSSLTRR
jgi:hypothetical protein